MRKTKFHKLLQKYLLDQTVANLFHLIQNENTRSIKTERHKTIASSSIQPRVSIFYNLVEPISKEKLQRNFNLY